MSAREMDISEHWKLCGDFTIVQAALLIAGYDPEEYEHFEEYEIRTRASGYTPARTALFNAVRSGTLQATHIEYEINGYPESRIINPYGTTISAADLDAFLNAKGRHCEFFDGGAVGGPAPWTASHPQFPRKLDAAIKAWTAVTSDRRALRGKSPKQALVKWLTDNATELGLLNKEGKPNRSGIEEICKVANWKPEGGAVPTPSADPPEDDGYGGFEPARGDGPRQGFQPFRPAGTPPQNEPAGPRETFSADLDDEIPF